jgi:hypothetical protein
MTPRELLRVLVGHVRLRLISELERLLEADAACGLEKGPTGA